MPRNNTLEVRDIVIYQLNEGGKLAYWNVEILVSTTRVFTTTDLDNRTVCAVMDTGTAAGLVIDKGAENDPPLGYVEDISNDGAVGMVLVVGLSDDVNYSETGGEDPDVGDAVSSDGDGEVKQAADGTTAGSRDVGRGHVVSKDTTNFFVRMWHP